MSESLPLIFFWPTMTVVGFAACLMGWGLGKYRRSIGKDADKESIGLIAGTVLSLVALLLGFTFSFSIGKFDERRNLVVEEANAIGTTLLRSTYLPEATALKVQDLLRRYIALRIQITPSNVVESINESNLLQDRLWLEAQKLAQNFPNSFVVGLFIESLNTTIDIQSQRILLGLRTRVPQLIWLVLFGISAISLILLGYQGGLLAKQSMGAQLLLIIAICGVFTLIVDMDTPAAGFFQIDKQAFIDLAEKWAPRP